ncbi:MAG TPA: anaerobic carbon-monoxide dehydrogenase catalytic subunit [bacterium]|nr:anaerobic carbon-monoxide dehydrogenase catalytic subunit [bacterium]HOL47105.1 anaerobic carbon-monoxide dehydrogenase catalytic subunit [bacterium]HPQ18859.1 anaerobic carbon-monoxide dehydrogenase catalytic subunit [bacterium]
MEIKKIKNRPYDDITDYMYNVSRKDGMETIYERFLQQQPQCAFGALGICCTLCTDGPCQITRKAKRGVCGATADLIVSRNLLQKCVQGTVANVYHARNVAKTLLATGEGKSDYEIKEPEKLKSIAEKFGINPNKPIKEIAREFGKFFISQINSNDYEELELVKKLAPKKRLEVWKKLGIIPGGPNSEAATALSKIMTNVNNDVEDLLLHCLRLGIANEYTGLFGITTMQEILVGTAKPNEGKVNIGILDKDAVNIIMHGHQPLLAIKVLEKAREKKFQEKAKEEGAKNGIKIYGSLCEGQQIFNIASEYKDVFFGQIGNWIQQEFIIATGAVDALVFDYNCVMPTISEQFAPKYHTKLISTDKVIRQAGVERLEFEPDKANEIAEKIIKEAIKAYKNRGEVNIPELKYSAISGFTTESVVNALGGTLKPLIDVIANGNVKGVAAVVGCTTVREFHSGEHITKLTEELIKRNILVIGAGCCSSAMQNVNLMSLDANKKAGKNLASVCKSLSIPPCLSYGSCTDIGKIISTAIAIADTLNVDIPDLPIAASAPEYMEQKAVADAFTAVAFGITLHLSPAPPVLGSQLVTKILTQDVENLTGGKVIVELDPIKSADLIEEQIINKRKKLGLK